MARTGGYAVLALNRSESSGGTYETRRGGDGVLYCTCKGWAFNKGTPKVCKHTRAYVGAHPGTSYGPAWPAVAGTVSAKAPASLRARKASVAPVMSAPAPANWREMLMAEASAAQARGVVTPVAAREAFAREVSVLDLDGPAGAGVAAAPSPSVLDLD